MSAGFNVIKYGICKSATSFYIRDLSFPWFWYPWWAEGYNQSLWITENDWNIFIYTLSVSNHSIYKLYEDTILYFLAENLIIQDLCFSFLVFHFKLLLVVNHPACLIFKKTCLWSPAINVKHAHIKYLHLLFAFL